MSDDDLTPYARSAHDWLRAGWRGVLPVPTGQKSPVPIGYTGASGGFPSPADVQTWIDYRPDLGNVALRLDHTIIGIDVDAYEGKAGGETLAALEAELGPLPPTVMSTSRTDGSGIRFYRVPLRPNWHDAGPGIEVIHYGHRYAIAPGSIHPNGGRYMALHSVTLEPVDDVIPMDAVAWLPEPWVDSLSSDVESPDKASVETREVVEWLEALPAGPPCKATEGAVTSLMQSLDTAIHAGGSRHEAVLGPVGALVRAGERGHRGVAMGLGEARAAFLDAVTAIDRGRRTPTEAVMEWRRMVAGAYAIVTADPTDPADVGCRCGQSLTGLDLGVHVLDMESLSTGSTPEHNNAITADTDTWAPVDGRPYVDGTWTPPEPRFLTRTDDHALLYPSRVNLMFGESEVGKGWVALHAVAQALTNGASVLYIDLEDYADTVYARLLLLGVDPEALVERLRYVRPDRPLDDPGRKALGSTYMALMPGLVIVDGVTGAMSLFGLDANTGTDVDRLYSLLAQPMADAGSAVLLIDHVTKATEGRGPGPIGSQHKRARVSGVSIEVRVVTRITPGRAGTLRLLIDKDRPGGVRATHPSLAGTFHMDATSTPITTRIEPPAEMPVDDEGRITPTIIMHRVCEALAAEPDRTTATKRALRSLVKGKAALVDTAIDRLVDGGYIEVDRGGGGHAHRLVRRFIADEVTPEVTTLEPGIGADEGDAEAVEFDPFQRRNRIGERE